MEDLTKSLSQYNVTADQVSNSIAKGLIPLALVMISIFFLVEMDSWWKTLKQEGGGLTSELWLEVAFKYLIAYFLVMMSSQILGAMLELVNIAIKIMNHIAPLKTQPYDVNIDHIKGWAIKQIIKVIGGTTYYIAGISVKLVTLLRFLQMYLLKALAPLLVALFISDSTRSIAINVMKYFAAAAFQGILLFLSVRLFTAIVTDDLLSLNMTGVFESWGTAFASIGKGVIFIFMIWGSQKVSKQLIGLL